MLSPGVLRNAVTVQVGVIVEVFVLFVIVFEIVFVVFVLELVLQIVFLRQDACDHRFSLRRDYPSPA